MAARYAFREPADQEYLTLPLPIRRVFEEILPSLVREPFRPGLGYTVAEVGGYSGLWKLKLRDFPPRSFRAIYEVDGDLVRFLGFGPRPGFYARLRDKDRLSRSRF